MKFWLMKSEPSAYSIDDLQRDGTTNWDGIRNYQARNFMREMRAGDKVLTSSGIIGIVVGVKENSLSIRSADAKLEILKSAVSQITERSGDAGDSKP